MEFSKGDLGIVLSAIAQAASDITARIHTVELCKAGTKNVYGEDQLALDVAADELMQMHLKATGLVGLLGSEEIDEPIRVEGGAYSVVFDPLDGSSLVDVNFSIGTIFGVYEGTELLGRTGREMVAAGFVVYGPRTTMMLSTGEGVNEYRLSGEGQWGPCERDVRVGEGKLFAPGNLRAAHERKDYFQLVEWWMKEQYTLRYSGGMVPDINHILIKGKGIFSYPAYSKFPQGKLRLLYECAPMAYLMEQAGGAASDGKRPILDIPIESWSQCTPIFVGSKEEVKRCQTFLN